MRITRLAAATVLVAWGCDGDTPTPTTPTAPRPTTIPASQTTTLTCLDFASLRPGTGTQVDFKLTAAGTRRVVADWNDPASNVDIYLGYCCGCPGATAFLAGGCVTLQSDTTLTKPAEFRMTITEHDLTVDPSAPGQRVAYAYNRGPNPVSGTLQATLTTSGSPPSGLPSCAPTSTSTTTTTVPGEYKHHNHKRPSCRRLHRDDPVGRGLRHAHRPLQGRKLELLSEPVGTCSSHDGVDCWVCPGVLCNP